MFAPETLLGVAKLMHSLYNNMAKASDDRREKVAVYLESLGDTIREAVALLKNGEPPTSYCTKMLAHSQAVVATISDVVGENVAKDIESKLRESYDIESMYQPEQQGSAKEQQRKLSVLDQAVGSFQATAELIRASK